MCAYKRGCVPQWMNATVREHRLPQVDAKQRAMPSQIQLYIDKAVALLSAQPLSFPERAAQARRPPARPSPACVSTLVPCLPPASSASSSVPVAQREWGQGYS